MSDCSEKKKERNIYSFLKQERTGEAEEGVGGKVR